MGRGSEASRKAEVAQARSGQGRHHVVDAARQRGHVVGVDGREHRDAQLVAAELAVRLGVDDPVGAQRLGDGGGVDRVVEVDGADDVAAQRRVGRRTGVAYAEASAQS